jgi:hypothetical protein
MTTLVAMEQKKYQLGNDISAGMKGAGNGK